MLFTKGTTCNKSFPILSCFFLSIWHSERKESGGIKTNTYLLLSLLSRPAWVWESACTNFNDKHEYSTFILLQVHNFHILLATTLHVYHSSNSSPTEHTTVHIVAEYTYYCGTGMELLNSIYVVLQFYSILFLASHSIHIHSSKCKFQNHSTQFQCPVDQIF